VLALDEGLNEVTLDVDGQQVVVDRDADPPADLAPQPGLARRKRREG
jgi:hypothetical protein